MLIDNSVQCGYQVIIVEKMLTKEILKEEEREEEISSTVIRKEINAGKIAKANVLMGRPFLLKGEVVHGRQLAGTALQMPTANIKWPDNKVMPAFGVYFTEALVDGRKYFAITNVGQKPTVAEEAEREVLAESYLYDFEGNLYGKEITLNFCQFLREEKKFDDIDALKEQLQMDMEAGRKFWQ